jgi:SPP1 family predicted phage head-tail adaptor
MRSGQLNKRITIQYEVSTADGMGGFSVVWTDLSALWAAIWPVSAAEHVKSMQTSMEITHRIRIRYQRFKIKPSYRIKFKDTVGGARYFNIISIIDPNERQVMLDIIAKETT